MTTCEVRKYTHLGSTTPLTPLSLQCMRSMGFARLSTSAWPRSIRCKGIRSRPHRRRKARGETTFRRATRRTRTRILSRLISSLRALKRPQAATTQDAVTCRPARRLRVLSPVPVAPRPLRSASRRGQDLSSLPSCGLFRPCSRNMDRRPFRPRSLASSSPADGHRRPASLSVRVDPTWALFLPR